MDYEKKYNEVLERFKTFKEKYFSQGTSFGDILFDKTGEMQEEFGNIFPELKESKNETIRKWIIREIKSKYFRDNNTNNIYASKALEWLEKQKEKKSEEWSEDNDLTIVDLINYFEGDSLRYSAEEMVQRIKSLRPQTHCKSSKEQKPAEEWIPDKNLILGIWELGNLWKQADVKEKEGLSQLAYIQKHWKDKNDYYERITSIPVQPAEWSEEDEKMRNLIVAIFEVNHPKGFFKANEFGTTDMRGVHTEEIISWLKSLRKKFVKED